MLYKPFFPLSLGEVKTKSCLSGLCMVGKGGGSVKRVQMEVEVPGSSHVAIASLWPPPIAMAPIVMSVVGCVSILEGQPWPWAPAQLPPRPECTLTICAHLSNDEKALPSPAVCVWGGGVPTRGSSRRCWDCQEIPLWVKVERSLPVELAKAAVNAWRPGARSAPSC